MKPQSLDSPKFHLDIEAYAEVSCSKTTSDSAEGFQYYDDDNDDDQSVDSAESVSDVESNEDLDINIDNNEVSLGAFISKTDKKIPRPQ